MSQFAITNLNPHFTIVFNEKRVIIQQETAMNIKQKSPPPARRVCRRGMHMRTAAHQSQIGPRFEVEN